MVTGGAFRKGDPGLAALAEARMAEDGLVRVNGWPRISPVEPHVVDHEHHLGMMWGGPDDP